MALRSIQGTRLSRRAEKKSCLISMRHFQGSLVTRMLCGDAPVLCIVCKSIRAQDCHIASGSRSCRCGTGLCTEAPARLRALSASLGWALLFAGVCLGF